MPGRIPVCGGEAQRYKLGIVIEPEPRANTATADKRPSFSLLQASCWLALVLIAAKAATPHPGSFASVPQRLITLLISSWTDVLFAVGCGAVAEVVVLVLGRWRRVVAIVRAIGLTFFAACAIYAVSAVGIFRYFSRPLTYELSGLIGNAAAIRSSVFARGSGSITMPSL